ncbi:MAG: queuosine precursor transporter [Clostridiales bacterium]|nr:queuosine precursor transporter [Clostridiales bacterium]
MKYQVPENPVKNREEGALFDKRREADFTPLVVIAALMAACYLAANIMAVKIIDVFGFSLFQAGVLIFPFSYMLGDVLAEIWGFRTARKVILLAFLCNLLFTGVTALGVLLPSPAYLSETADAYNTVFSYMPRIVAASFAAFLAGELTNAWVMAWIRRLTGVRLLWVRTIGSSVAGQLLDTLIFCTIAFAGTLTTRDLFIMIGSLYLVKIGIEALFGTPLAYAVIGRLRRYFEAREKAPV